MKEAPVIPEIRDQDAFNLERWQELRADPVLAALDHRIETDRYGHVIMTPPPGFSHGAFQARIAVLLGSIVEPGMPATETPISTSEGIRAADVAWISLARLAKSRKSDVLTIAPEICVEVLSPSNLRGEIAEKKRLYFETGAEEVWVCDLDGRIFVYRAGAPDEPTRSIRCPSCPDRLED